MLIPLIISTAVLIAFFTVLGYVLYREKQEAVRERESIKKLLKKVQFDSDVSRYTD